MKMENEVFLEIEGVAKTIIQYTNDLFIRSYATKIQSISVEEDNEIFFALVSKLVEWYQEEIEKIKLNEFVVNKESHIKSYYLLNRWKSKFDYGRER